MTDKPNYSLKDLLNELKEKEEEFENCEIVIQDNNKSKNIFEEVLNIKLESKEYLELDVEQQCSLIMSKKAEISALKKGIKACEEMLNSQELNSISPNEQKKMQQAENRIEPRGLLEGDSVDKTAVPDTQTNCPLGKTIKDFNLNNTSTNLNLNKGCGK